MLPTPTIHTITEILGLISGRRATTGNSLATADSAYRIEGLIFPSNVPALSLKGDLQSLMTLSSTALIGAPTCFPISSFAHVFDSEFFGSSFQFPVDVAPRDESRARMGAFLAVAELFTYLNESRSAGPSPTAAHYTRTFAYALSRSKLLWPNTDSAMLFERWIATRTITGWSPNSLLPPDKVLEISDFWTGQRGHHQWAHPLLSQNGNDRSSVGGDIANSAVQLVSQKFSLSLPPLPESFDARFEWLANSVKRLEFASPNVKDLEFAVGLLLASIEPGELMHLNWLRTLLRSFPGVAMHYAGWSAELSSRRQDRPDVFNGLIRRLIRELNRPFRLDEAPTEDLSWIDLEVVRDMADETKLRASGKSLLISLIPGVVIGASLNIVPSEGAAKPSAVKQVRNEQRAALKQSPLFADTDESVSNGGNLKQILKEIESIKAFLTARQTPKPKPPRKPKVP